MNSSRILLPTTLTGASSCRHVGKHTLLNLPWNAKVDMQCCAQRYAFVIYSTSYFQQQLVEKSLCRYHKSEEEPVHSGWLGKKQPHAGIPIL